MKRTKSLTYLALFMAIEAVLVMVPFLGFIPIGPLRATTLHIPVIIAAIVLGTKEGCLVGLIFGLFSLFNNTINPTVTSFAFSPFISGNILSAVIAIVPRVLIGFVSGEVYRLMKNRFPTAGMFVSSFLGALTNTALVLGGIYLLFGQAYAKALGRSFASLAPYFISVISTQSLLEAVVGAIIAVAVSKALLKVKRG
ncbi:MAG: ECF transporter S component [Intestinibaculum porci]|uniref:ECF transporter S component n=1 Tax=Intestinibaculum porci TaxID=2487118 RepID=UPI00240A8D61|nr:ECF transporter S component [Intestinibaculum porci]MDD6422032.1 ECF transporter S component [Intestinibaculum porci]